MMNGKEDIVFSRNTVEFVTVAAEYCAYVERSNEHARKEFIETLLKLLPLLYLKAQMLPDGERMSDDDLDKDWDFTCFVYESQSFGHKSRFDKLRAVFDAYPGNTTREKVEAYLKELGFTDADFNKLRSLLLES
jgi:hypothetical protein